MDPALVSVPPAGIDGNVPMFTDPIRFVPAGVAGREVTETVPMAAVPVPIVTGTEDARSWVFVRG